MPKTCCYGNCNSDTRYPDRLDGGKVRFIPFPKPRTNMQKCLEWIQLCGRPRDKLYPARITGNYFVCTKHFVDPSGPTTAHPDPVQADPYTPRLSRRAMRERLQKEKLQSATKPVINEGGKNDQSDSLSKIEAGCASVPIKTEVDDSEYKPVTYIDNAEDSGTDSYASVGDCENDINVKSENSATESCGEGLKSQVDSLVIVKKEVPETDNCCGEGYEDQVDGSVTVKKEVLETDGESSTDASVENQIASYQRLISELRDKEVVTDSIHIKTEVAEADEAESIGDTESIETMVNNVVKTEFGDVFEALTDSSDIGAADTDADDTDVEEEDMNISYDSVKKRSQADLEVKEKSHILPTSQEHVTSTGTVVSSERQIPCFYQMPYAVNGVPPFPVFLTGVGGGINTNTLPAFPVLTGTSSGMNMSPVPTFPILAGVGSGMNINTVPAFPNLAGVGSGINIHTAPAVPIITGVSTGISVNTVPGLPYYSMTGIGIRTHGAVAGGQNSFRTNGASSLTNEKNACAVNWQTETKSSHKYPLGKSRRDMRRVPTTSKKHSSSFPPGSKYKLGVCDNKNASENTPAKDKKSHKEEPPYKCNMCSAEFAYRSFLILHKIAHTQERPYKCDKCDEGFTTTSYLKVHEQSHSGCHVYECDICSGVFLLSSVLEVHRKTHPLEEPFKCDVCDEGFFYKHQLDLHSKKHKEKRTKANGGKHTSTEKEKINMCDICGKGFARKAFLLKHHETHTSMTSKELQKLKESQKPKNPTKLKDHKRVRDSDKIMELNKAKSTSDTSL